MSKAKKDSVGGLQRLRRKEYEKQLRSLQLELAHLQDWVVEKGLRVVILFEGRDAAGKGGVIKRIIEKVSQRVFRVVALPKPSERERSQFYWQRYVAQLPAAGEVVLFDRSWYNRAGVEPVMGFCSNEQYERFLKTCPGFERALVDTGIILLKYWLTVSNEQQLQRFEKRISDPGRQWKLSPIDLESRRRWFAYSRARDRMLDETDTSWAPWFIVRSDDQRRARLNCIAHLLSRIDYQQLPFEVPVLPDREEADGYDDVSELERRNFVPDKF